MAELEKVRRKRNRKLFLRRLLLLCAACAVAVTVFYMAQGGTLKVGTARMADTLMTFLAGDTMPVTLASNRPIYMADAAGRIALADSSTLSVYTHAGRQVASHVLGYQNPAFRTNGPRVLGYDIGGTRFDVFFWDDREVSFDTGETIYCADLAANGNVAIGGSSASALSGVRVYVGDNLAPFEWSSSELMVSAVALDNSGDRIVFSGVSTEGGEVYSSLILYRIDREEPEARVKLPGEVVVALSYHSHGITAISDKGVTLIGENGQLKSHYEYEQTPVAFALSDKGQVGLVLGDYDDDHVLSVLLFSSSLKALGSWGVAEEISQLGFGGGGLYFVSGEQMLVCREGAEPAAVRIPEGILALPGKTVYYATPTHLKKVAMP